MADHPRYVDVNITGESDAGPVACEQSVPVAGTTGRADFWTSWFAPARWARIALVTNESASMGDEVTKTGVFETVLDGYDAVYDALPSSEVFSQIWREKAYGDEFPDEFAHIGFLTPAEGQRLLEFLRLAGGTLVDVASGTGGPGLWFAQQTGATLIGVDPSASGVAAATRRAERVGRNRRASLKGRSSRRAWLTVRPTQSRHRGVPVRAKQAGSVQRVLSGAAARSAGRDRVF